MAENKKVSKKFGYIPSWAEKTLATIFRAINRALHINGRGRISNLFIQQLDPQREVIWRKNDSQLIPLTFRTGHGRLLWRANTFETEEPMMISWLNALNPSDVFYDIGSNVGTYTIPAAKVCKQVYSFELDPINIGIQKENIFLNNVNKKVLLIPIALGEKKGIQDIFYRDFSRGDALQSVGGESTLNTRISNAAHTNSQIIMPLDAIVEEFRLAHPTKIKIDVDGNEKIVFNGAKKTILIAEQIYFEHSGQKDCDDILEFMIGNGFSIMKTETPENSVSGYNMILTKKPI
jgi:FkbM family methyltransferase